jgi:hypothetical protein
MKHPLEKDLCVPNDGWSVNFYIEDKRNYVEVYETPT